MEKKEVDNADIKERLEVRPRDLLELGIIEHENISVEEKYPFIKGKGMVQEGLAIVEMICRAEKLPARKELAKKYFEDQERRGKKLSIESLGFICEGIGCQSQIGVLKVDIYTGRLSSNIC